MVHGAGTVACPIARRRHTPHTSHTHTSTSTSTHPQPPALPLPHIHIYVSHMRPHPAPALLHLYTAARYGCAAAATYGLRFTVYGAFGYFGFALRCSAAALASCGCTPGALRGVVALCAGCCAAQAKDKGRAERGAGRIGQHWAIGPRARGAQGRTQGRKGWRPKAVSARKYQAIKQVSSGLCAIVQPAT